MQCKSVASGAIESSFLQCLRVLPFLHPVAARSPAPEVAAGGTEEDLEVCFLQSAVSCPSCSIASFEFADCSLNGVAVFHAFPIVLGATFLSPFLGRHVMFTHLDGAEMGCGVSP